MGVLFPSQVGNKPKSAKPNFDYARQWRKPMYKNSQ